MLAQILFLYMGVHQRVAVRKHTHKYSLHILLCPALGPVWAASLGDSGNALLQPGAYFSLQNPGRWSCFNHCHCTHR